MKNTINNLKEVYKYGKKYRLSLILQIIGCIISIAINIALPILTAKEIVNVTDNVMIQIVVVGIAIMIVNFIHHLKTVLIRKNTQIFYRGVMEDIQKELEVEILRISQKEIDSNSTGMFMQRMTNDVSNMSNMFTIGMGNLTGIISSIGIFISIFVISKECFLYYGTISALLTFIYLIKAKKYNVKDRLDRKQQEKVSGMIGELIRGSRDIKMLNAKEGYIDELNINIKEQNDRHIDMRNVEIKYNFIIGILSSIFEFILIILLVYLINSNKITIALALALHSYRFRVIDTFMGDISKLLEQSNSFNISCERVFSILNNKTFEKESFGKKHINKINGNFEFKDVYFGYTKDNKVLKGLNFKIDSNNTIGFIGKSGVGKTTIFNLLCKMYNIDSGSILIDGININELDEESIRGNITIISQSPYIFNMSIKDNLRLVKKDITDKEIKEACKIACLDEFVEQLPDKYDTIVGEGGVMLSGGQRQRLAIARAFVQKTKIILFDEATSALDNDTQSKIQKAIDNLKDEYTILIIAHRLSTIINCDKILLMDDGKIVDEGTHTELLNNNEVYQNLCKTELVK